MSAHDQLRFMHTLHGLQFGVYNATYANCPDNIFYIGFLTCKHTCFLWSSSECSVTYSAFNFTTPVSTHLPNTPCAASTVFICSLTSEACLGSLCTRLLTCCTVNNAYVSNSFSLPTQQPRTQNFSCLGHTAMTLGGAAVSH